MRRLFHPWIALLLASCAVVCPISFSARAQIDSTYGPLPVFELHSSFWINLHHTLYDDARQHRPAGSHSARTADAGKPALQISPESRATLSAAEQRAWDDAVSYYA